MTFTEIVSLVGGVIGGLYALSQLTVDIWFRVKNRERILLANYRVQYHVNRYGESEIENAVRLGGHFSGEPLADIGKERLRQNCHRAFTVIEFELQNKYSEPITVGRLSIDDWIFSDHWFQPMYQEKRNYRVYDLYTRERADLASYARLAPGDLLGRRIEIIETCDGPNYVSNHLYLFVPIHKSFSLRLSTTKGSRTFPIPIHKELPTNTFYNIYRWSGDELLREPQETSGGMAVP